MKYSYNLDKKDVIFASASDLNASFKDLCAVCDSVRYKPLPAALQILDGVINEGRPIEFRRHNRYMGDRATGTSWEERRAGIRSNARQW
jgi:ribosomal protein L22